MATVAVPVTALHASRLLYQVQTNLVSLQTDFVNNANAWIGMANAQSPDLPTLRGFINSAVSSYQTRMGWITTAQNDPTNGPLLTQQLARAGMTAADINTPLAAMQGNVTALAAQPLLTYAGVITACNTIIANVIKSPSIWPE